MAACQGTAAALPAPMLQDVISIGDIVKQKGLPPFEADINLLIDSFVWQVRHGAMPSLATFKQIWQKMFFSFIHQAVPPVMQSWDHQQLLYSAALNRLDQLEGPFLAEAAKADLPPGKATVGPCNLQWHVSQRGMEMAAGSAQAIHHHHMGTQQDHDTQQAAAAAAVVDAADRHNDEHINQLMEGLLDDPILHVHGNDNDIHNQGPLCLPDSNHGGLDDNEPSFKKHPQQAVTVTEAHVATDVQPGNVSGNASVQMAASDESQLQTEVQNYCAQVRQLAVDVMGHEVHVALREAGLPNLNQPTNHNQLLLENPHVPLLDNRVSSAAPFTHYQQAYEKYQAVQGLASSLGALYCLYCLYNTQLIHPRTRIYLPVKLLKYLTALPPLYMELGLMTPVKVLQSLWSNQAFLIGAVRKPRHGEYKSHINPSGPRTLAGLTVNPMLMQSRPIRDALLHIRSGLNTLMDFKKLTDMTHQYASIRQSVFQPRSKSKGKDGAAPHSSDLPPFIFDGRFAFALKSFIHDEGKTVWASLHPLARKQVGTKKRKGVQRQEVIPIVDETEATDTTVMQLTGVFGDIMRRKQEKEKRAAASQSAAQVSIDIAPSTSHMTQPQIVVQSSKRIASQKLGLRSRVPLDPKLRKELAQAGLLVDDMEQEEEQEKAVSDAVGGKAKEVVRNDLLRRTAHMEMGGAWLTAHDALMWEDDNNEEDDDDDLHMPDILGLVSGTDKANSMRVSEPGVSAAQNPEGLETDRLKDLGEEALAAELSQWMDEIAPEPSETGVGTDKQKDVYRHRKAHADSAGRDEAGDEDNVVNDSDGGMSGDDSVSEQMIGAGKVPEHPAGTSNDSEDLRTDVSAAIATVVRALPNARAANASWLKRGQQGTSKPTTWQSLSSEVQKSVKATEQKQANTAGKVKAAQTEDHKRKTPAAKQGTKPIQTAPVQAGKANKRKRQAAVVEATADQADENVGDATEPPPARKTRKAVGNGTAKATADAHVDISNESAQQLLQTSRRPRGMSKSGRKRSNSRGKSVSGTKRNRKRRTSAEDETSEDSDVEDIDMQLEDTGTSDEDIADTGSEPEKPVANKRKEPRQQRQTKDTDTAAASPQQKTQQRQQLLFEHQASRQRQQEPKVEPETAPVGGNTLVNTKTDSHINMFKAGSVQREQTQGANAASEAVHAVAVSQNNNTVDVDEDPVLQRLAAVSQRNAALLQSVRAAAPTTSPQKAATPSQHAQTIATETGKQSVGSLKQPAVSTSQAGKPSSHQAANMPLQQKSAVGRQPVYGRDKAVAKVSDVEHLVTSSRQEQAAHAINTITKHGMQAKQGLMSARSQVVHAGDTATVVPPRTARNQGRRATNGVMASYTSNGAKISRQKTNSRAANKPNVYQAVVDGDDVGLGLAIAADLGWDTDAVGNDAGFNRQDLGSVYGQEGSTNEAMDVVDSVEDLRQKAELSQRKDKAATSRAAEVHGEMAELDGLSSDEEVTQALGSSPMRLHTTMQAPKASTLQPFNTPGRSQLVGKKGLQQAVLQAEVPAAAAHTEPGLDPFQPPKAGVPTAGTSAPSAVSNPAAKPSALSLLHSLIEQPPKPQPASAPAPILKEASAIAAMLAAGLKRPLNTHTPINASKEAKVISLGSNPMGRPDLVAQQSHTSQQALNPAVSPNSIAPMGTDLDTNDDPIFTRLASLMDRTQKTLAASKAHDKS